MTERIKVRNQAEFDICVKAGNIAIVIGCRVVARENSSVLAWGNSSVVAWENSSVEAWGNSSVEAWENSSVVARGNVFVRLFSALKIKASASVVVMMHGKAKTITGGQRVTAKVPTTAFQWCAHYGVVVKKGVVVLFKGVADDFSTKRSKESNIYYKPGTKPSAKDWDGGIDECGGGLHFSPHPKMTIEFNSSAKRFVACPVRMKDIAVHKDAVYPQKVKAKCCCAPVYEVDKNGKRL